MKKITWCTEVQSPYNDFLLSEIHKFFILKVFYQRKKINTHPWDFSPVSYDTTYMKGNFLKAVKSISTSHIVIISGWSFWQHFIIMLLPSKSTKKVYWTDTVNLDKNEWKGLRGCIRRVIVKIVFNVFDEVWSTGQPGCKVLIKLGCKEKKVKSFPFFIDLSRYTNLNGDKRIKGLEFKTRYSNANSAIIFLCVGQLIYRKGYADAIKALSLLNNKNALLWIVGIGSLESELKQLVKDLNLNEQVKFIGWLQQEDVELAFISSDIFIHPAIFDPFPTVVLDAMTWGKPIIGTQTAGSVLDRVIHGINGFIYPSGSVEMLCKHMHFFVQNNEKINLFGLASRETACKYPIEIAITQLKDLLNPTS